MKKLTIAVPFRAKKLVEDLLAAFPDWIESVEDGYYTFEAQPTPADGSALPPVPVYHVRGLKDVARFLLAGNDLHYPDDASEVAVTAVVVAHDPLSLTEGEQEEVDEKVDQTAAVAAMGAVAGLNIAGMATADLKRILGLCAYSLGLCGSDGVVKESATLADRIDLHRNQHRKAEKNGLA